MHGNIFTPAPPSLLSHEDILRNFEDSMLKWQHCSIEPPRSLPRGLTLVDLVHELAPSEHIVPLLDAPSSSARYPSGHEEVDSSAAVIAIDVKTSDLRQGTAAYHSKGMICCNLVRYAVGVCVSEID